MKHEYFSNKISLHLVDLTEQFTDRLERLEAEKRQLTATNSQLAATNSHLVSTNSHLVATNSHLVTMNSDLVATNSQLFATNSQLFAINSQLTATNGKLLATRNANLLRRAERNEQQPTDDRPSSTTNARGYTGQYLDMNPLISQYINLGFFITGFPCNQFNLQEPAKNHEILNGIKYVRPGNGFTPAPNFHIYGKLKVNGNDAHPMYKFLKEACPSTTNKLGLKSEMMWDVIRVNDLWWNFEKFVIDRDGRPMYRINPSVWNHGDVVRPLLEEAFRIKQGSNNNNNILQQQPSAAVVNSGNISFQNSIKPLGVLG